MKFLVLASVLLPASFVVAIPRADLGFVMAFLADIRVNMEQYAEFHRTYPQVHMVPEIFKLLVDAQYHTDDSWTTMIPPKFPVDELKTMALELPWYDDRLSAVLLRGVAGMTEGNWAGVTPPPAVPEPTK